MTLKLSHTLMCNTEDRNGRTLTGVVKVPNERGGHRYGQAWIAVAEHRNNNEGGRIGQVWRVVAMHR